ncbi:ribosomal protein S18-alanine N-acetyltransferase [Bifidobacterium callimiconis]|uniref:Ribosomal-protein-alanine N-acetyltransferase RimI n=1 Tax=Bifidobacterium callimiconis TaxID=2306973 RepID=A0A430FEV9_9BIFI|nr:ribosomal protein S18-alanine N-acetyltransferase [Bifidobacterium callimiconis]RSX51435.1 ribosomal-protein-alanine N-acetyltransferase RimI [Bifidobacterium callimiconis]
MLIALEDLDRDTVVGAFAALEAELFGKGAWSENAIRQELDAPARTYVFDVDDATKTIRGYAGFWYDGDDAELMTIGVDKAHQRQGIAAALLGRLLQDAERQGARRMLLEVRVDNDPAIALYQRFGFTVMGRRKRYYQPEGIDAYTMSVDIQPHVMGFQASDGDADGTNHQHETINHDNEGAAQ